MDEEIGLLLRLELVAAEAGISIKAWQRLP